MISKFTLRQHTSPNTDILTFVLLNSLYFMVAYFFFIWNAYHCLDVSSDFTLFTKNGHGKQHVWTETIELKIKYMNLYCMLHVVNFLA